MSSHPIITGHLANSGRRYVRIQTQLGSATLPYESFSMANTKLAADLTACGLPLMVKDDLETIIKEVRALSAFEPKRVIEHSGWDGKVFGQLDGTVNIGEGPVPEVLFQRTPDRVNSRGLLENWKQQVFQPLADHPVPAFALMAMFLPPLLRFMPQVGNLTFELVGPGGFGKSVAQTLAASVVGPFSYVSALRDVQRDLAGVQRLSRDYPLIIDHVSSALATTSKPKKADIFTAIDYDLRRALGGRVTLLSGRYPLSDACAMPTLEHGIITIPMLASICGHSNFTDVVDDLVKAATANHGLAFPAFLLRLRQKLEANHKKVKSQIEGAQARFLLAALQQGGESADLRIARACAAVSAAGHMARRFRVLPSGFPYEDIALTVFDLIRKAEGERQPFLMRLEGLAASGKLVTITEGADPAVQANAVGTAIGTLTNRPGGRVIKIAPDKVEEAFLDWKRIKQTDDVRGPEGPLKLDGKNLTTWGRLAPGPIQKNGRASNVMPSLYQHASPIGTK
jgi:Domain of unknown function (DUF927)